MSLNTFNRLQTEEQPALIVSLYSSYLKLTAMARIESDRDDLFAELSSANPRWEFMRAADQQVVVAGVRSENRLSIFFNPDCCYHFDGNHRLRRAYVNGFLYRTQGTTLARLRRERTPEQVQLLRSDLSPHELTEFLHDMQSHLQQFENDLKQQKLNILRAEGDNCGSLLNLQQWIHDCRIASPPLADPFPTRKR